LDVNLSAASELSLTEVARIYLWVYSGKAPDYKLASLLGRLSSLRRLCKSFLDGTVAGRVFADNFEAIYHQAVSIAEEVGYRELGSLEDYWTDVDAYPDLEAEKREEGFTDDSRLREIAREAMSRLDGFWGDVLRLAKP